MHTLVPSPPSLGSEVSLYPSTSTLSFSRSAPVSSLDEAAAAAAANQLSSAQLSFADDIKRLRPQLTPDSHSFHLLQQQQQHHAAAAAAMNLNLPSFVSPSTNLAYLSSPSQPLMSFSPPSLSSSLPMSTPSFNPSSFSPAFSPNLFVSAAAASSSAAGNGSGAGSGGANSAAAATAAGVDSKSLSRYRVLDGAGSGGGLTGGAGKVSDEHLKILATLTQLSQTNGFSSPAQHQQQPSAFNPLPLQPPLGHATQQQQHAVGSPPQLSSSSQHIAPMLTTHLTQQHPGLLQQPIPVQPLSSHSSLLTITPPMASASLLSKTPSAAPSHSPPPANSQLSQRQQQQQQQQQQQMGGMGGVDMSSISPAVLLHHLQLVLQQHMSQQAQSVQLTGSPSSPSTLSSLQQLQHVQQVGLSVLSSLRPEQLHAVVGVVQQRGAAVLPTLLLQMGQEDRQQQQHQQQQQMQQMQQMHQMQQQQQQMTPESQLSTLLSPPQHSGLFVGHPALQHSGQPSYYLSHPHLLHAAAGGADADMSGLADEMDPDGSRRRSVSGRLLAGSSCHQCKTRRISAELVYCAQSHVKKGRQRKRQMLAAATAAGGVGGVVAAGVGGKQERLCRKKYCCRCIQKFYGEQPPAKIGPNGDRNWSCPGCRGLCSCAACKRQQSKREIKKRSLASAQAAAAKEGKLMASGGGGGGGGNGGGGAGEDSKDGQPPVFSSSIDGHTPTAKQERREKADNDAVKAEHSDSGSSSSSSGSSAAETPLSGSSSLAVPLANSAALEATSTEVSPATTHSSMSAASSFGSSSNGNTPPTPLTHLQPLSAVVTPAPVYSTLSGASFSPNMPLSSLSSLSSSPLLPLNQSMLYSTAFLSPNTTYTSLSNLPLFPSAFSASPPSSPFTSSHLLLPGLSTPHLPVSSIGGVGASSVPSAVGLDSASSLLALTGPSPITWQRSLRAPQATITAAITPSPEQQQQQQPQQPQPQQLQQQQRTTAAS